MFIAFLAPGAGLASGTLPGATAGTAAAGTASGFAAGIVGALAAPIFDLLFPAPTAVATIDGLPPGLLEPETSTSIPPVLFTYDTEVEGEIGDPPFQGGQSPGVLYDIIIRNNSANLTTCIPYTFTNPGFDLVGAIGGLQQFAIIDTVEPGESGSNTTGQLIQFVVVHDSGNQTTPVLATNWFTGCGTGDATFIESVVRSDGQPDTGGDPPPQVLIPPTPNIDADPEVIPPPIEFPAPNPDPNQDEEPKAPFFPNTNFDIINLPSPVEIGAPQLLPDTGIDPPPEIDFTPPPIPVIPIPIPIITTPTIPDPLIIPFPRPNFEEEETPGEVAQPEPLPELEGDDRPVEFPPLPFPGLLTPEGQIISLLELCCDENLQQQEDCCDEILEKLEEIKEQLDDIEYEVNPPPPGDGSLQLKSSGSGEEVLVSGESNVIWIRVIYITLPNLNKRIVASNPVLTALWGTYLNYLVNGKFSTSLMVPHSDNFFQAPKRCTGFGLFFKHGASGRAEYYVRTAE